MGFSELIEKAKQWISGNPEKVNSFLDKGGEQLKQRFGHESQIDSGIEQARRRLTDGESSEGPGTDTGETPRAESPRTDHPPEG